MSLLGNHYYPLTLNKVNIPGAPFYIIVVLSDIDIRPTPVALLPYSKKSGERPLFQYTSINRGILYHVLPKCANHPGLHPQMTAERLTWTPKGRIMGVAIRCPSLSSDWHLNIQHGEGFVPNYHARFKTVTVLVTSTLILAFSGYHTLFGNRVLSEFVVYFIVPLGLIVLVLRENPLRYGLKPGDWRRGLAYTAGGVVLMAVIIPLAARMSGFQSYYGARGPDIISLKWVLSTGAALFAWEFFFRGFMLFGLEEGLGWYAAIVQAVPFTLAHIGKPELETYACIVGGTLIGLVGLRVRSFYPAFFIHWFITVTLEIVVRGGWR